MVNQMLDEKLIQRQAMEYDLTRRLFAVRTLHILERALEVTVSESPLNGAVVAAIGVAIADVLSVNALNHF